DLLSITASSVTQPAHGTLTMNVNGTFAYVPASGFAGTDSFTYRADDGQPVNHLSNVATVTITVTNACPNTPDVVNDNYTTLEDTTLNVNAAAGVLANDADANGDLLVAILDTGPAHGTLNLDSNGSFAYGPAANFNGLDSFTYRASDGQFLSCRLATATI